MPTVRFTVGLMSNLRFQFSVTVRDRRVDRQTWEIELMFLDPFLEITRILMNFAGGMQRRRNVSKSGVVRLSSRRRRREQRRVSQTSSAAGIEAPKAPRAVGHNIFRGKNLKFCSVLKNARFGGNFAEHCLFHYNKSWTKCILTL